MLSKQLIRQFFNIFYLSQSVRAIKWKKDLAEFGGKIARR
jgi:hypothetical protein